MCEVALGEMFEVPASEPISNPNELEDKKSVHLAGKYHPDPAIIGQNTSFLFH